MSKLSRVILFGGLLVLQLHPAFAQQKAKTPTATPQTTDAQDGQRAFDFEIGTWATHLKRLRNPLSGSTRWVGYKGTSIVRDVLDGRANLVELRVDGPAGRIEGLSLRLYNPETRQWTLNFANIADGLLTEPMVGEFRDGRGEFYARET